MDVDALPQLSGEYAGTVRPQEMKAQRDIRSSCGLSARAEPVEARRRCPFDRPRLNGGKAGPGERR